MGSSNHYLLFTAADGNLLIRILIPLIIGMVLLGTMVSYTVAIVSGVWVNWLLKIG